MAAAKPNGCFGVSLCWSIEVRQALDSGGRELRQRVRNAASRNDTVGGDLGQRHQHEGALEQPRMRQRQFRLVEPDVVIGDQIEVEGARTPARLIGAIAAELLLDLVQREQQRMRIEAGLDLDAGIDEAAPAVPRPRAGWRSRTNARAGRPASCRRCWRWPSGMWRGRRRHCRRARSGRRPCQGDCRLRISTTPTSSKIAAIGACGL